MKSSILSICVLSIISLIASGCNGFDCVDGSGNQAMWIVPSKDLVVLRFGPPPTRRPGEPGEFDNSRLPNTIIKGLT